MTEYLHFNKAYGLGKPKTAFNSFLRYAVIVFFLFGLGSTIYGQTRNDTWFRAGKAINSDPGAFNFYDHNPLPPGNNTSVTTWFDIVDFVSQDAIPHPAAAGFYPNAWNAANPGFDYSIGSGHLHPVGTVPGVPTFRRNATDNINFNPVVQFDGSGNGQALHFHSVVRENVAVFIVFKAVGAGNSAETQRLLFGGAVDTLHTSASQNQWAGNLSLGIADNNRLSIGRNWFTGDRSNYDIADNQTFFQSGAIDLLGEPTIGAFIRTTGVDQETLDTFVNGITDIHVTRSGDPFFDNPLFDYNRLGKHFNSSTSDYNLTGDIAEVLVLDIETLNPITNNIRQRVESYLAVKYGITLTDDNQLGSIVGNGTYDYLAADGAIIWTSDVTYMHDIAGIGVDRHGSVGAPDYRLWYNLDQRISKSVNSDAIVTVSTNTDFSTDNLDLTRTRISGDGFSLDHNYLLWANNDLSINATTSDVPAGITHKLARQWMVQSTRTAANPISNVSIRVDLSGSDILSLGDCIVLLIDEDGDGDFTTGAIRKVVASSVDGSSNTYFDGITFSEITDEIFTVGIEVLNPGVDTTIDICIGDNTLYDLNLQLNGSPDSGGTWTDVDDAFGGGLNSVLPSITSFSSLVVGTYRFTYTISNSLVSCSDETATLTVNIVDPMVNAGDNESICGLADHVIQNASASGHDSFTWSILSGDGSLNNINSLIPTYQPHVNDIGTTVIIQLEVFNSAGCDASDTVELNYIDQPIADAGTGGTVCDIVNAFNTSATIPVGVGTWTNESLLVGNAMFGNPNSGITTITVDTPGTYTFRWTDANGTCSDFDEISVTFDAQPAADAHEPALTTDFQECGLSYEVDALAAIGMGTWSLVSGPGTLSFSTNTNDPDQVLTVGTYGSYTFRWTDVNGSCTSSDDINVEFFEDPTVANAGPDIVQCGNDSFNMAANTPVVGAGTWSVFIGPIGVIIADVSDPSTMVTGLAPGSSATLRWTIVNGACLDSFDDVTITNNLQPSISVDTFSDPTTCGGNDGSIDLLFNNTPDGLHTIVYDSGNFPNVNVGSAMATITGLSAGNFNNLRVTVNGCTSTEDPDVSLVDPTSPNTGLGVDAEDDPICENMETNIRVENSEPGVSYQLRNDADNSDVGLAVIGTGGSINLPTGNLFATTTFNVLATNLSGCQAELITIVTVTINATPVVDVLADVEACDTFSLPALTTGAYFTGTGGTGSSLSAGDAITTSQTVFIYAETGTTPNCSDESSFTVTINATPVVDVLADVEACDTFSLPALTTGAYFTGTGGTGSSLSAGDAITTSQTVFIYAETGTTPNCSDESSFTVTINSISGLVSVDNEVCLNSGTGAVNISMNSGVAPYTIHLNTMQPIIFNTNVFTIGDLPSGTYTLNVTDAQGCETNDSFDIETEGIDLSAEIAPVYGCDLGEFSNYIDIELNHSIMSSDVLYALDSTDPNDFIINPDFINISEGEHFLSILHINGCMETIPFEIDQREPLRLSLNSSNINNITATVTGGTAPYTYFFDDQSASGDNTYSITYSGIHTVRVLDGNGCEVIQTISLEFLDIEIPNFFTPNNDGQNDTWTPKNIEGFPNIETIIFDRYGREIRLIGALGNGWDGFYESKPLPSGDYWYIVKLNDGSEREFVGNFTLYR